MPKTNDYSGAFLERQYHRVEMASTLLEAVCDSMNYHKGPIDDLFKQVDAAYSETLCLLDMLRKMTNSAVYT